MNPQKSPASSKIGKKEQTQTSEVLTAVHGMQNRANAKPEKDGIKNMSEDQKTHLQKKKKGGDRFKRGWHGAMVNGK